MSPQVAPQEAATVPTAFTVGYRAPQKPTEEIKKTPQPRICEKKEVSLQSQKTF